MVGAGVAAGADVGGDVAADVAAAGLLVRKVVIFLRVRVIYRGLDCLQAIQAKQAQPLPSQAVAKPSQARPLIWLT